MTKWKSIDERPEWDQQPMRQFIHIEGYSEHSGYKWHRAICGTAFIRKPGADDEMLQYRKSDILQLCKDGDMDPYTARIMHWMPAIFPAFEEVAQSPQVTASE